MNKFVIDIQQPGDAPKFGVKPGGKFKVGGTECCCGGTKCGGCCYAPGTLLTATVFYAGYSFHPCLGCEATSPSYTEHGIYELMGCIANPEIFEGCGASVIPTCVGDSPTVLHWRRVSPPVLGCTEPERLPQDLYTCCIAEAAAPIVATVEFPVLLDTYLDKLDDATAFGGQDYVEVGKGTSGIERRRTLQYFGNSLLAGIPSGANILSAKIRRHCIVPSILPQPMSYWIVGEDWAELAATWEKRDATHFWADAGATLINAGQSFGLTQPGAVGAYEYDVTASFIWCHQNNGGEVNLCNRLDVENVSIANSFARFSSRENTEFPEDVLVVEWTLSSGFSYWGARWCMNGLCNMFVTTDEEVTGECDKCCCVIEGEGCGEIPLRLDDPCLGGLGGYTLYRHDRCSGGYMSADLFLPADNCFCQLVTSKTLSWHVEDVSCDASNDEC